MRRAPVVLSDVERPSQIPLPNYPTINATDNFSGDGRDLSLIPTLSLGDIVIMDNLPAHKAASVRDAIETAGAKLMFLPPYSPVFNPIENASSNSRGYYVQRPKEPSAPYGTLSQRFSTSSLPTNAQTISKPRGMNQIKQEVF
jgi:hypothetical protein